MEALKVLIIEDEFFSKVEKSLKGLLSALGLEGIFSFAINYDEANEKISRERFHIVSLDDFLDDEAGGKETNSLIEKILRLNPSACVFSLVSEIHQNLVENIRGAGIKHFFAKSYNFGVFEDIIHPDDAKEIKEAIIETGVVSYLVSAFDLTETVRIFSHAYTKLRPSEKIAQDACDCVAVKLNAKEIKYAIFDYESHVDVVVEVDKKTEVIEIALKSGLKFWHDYVVKNWIQL